MARRAVLSLAVFSLMGATSAAPAAEVLTLDQAVADAVRNNRTIANASLQVQRAEKDVGATKTLRLPNLDLDVFGGKLIAPVRVTFPAGAMGVYPATGPIPGRDIDIEADKNYGAFINATLAQPLSQLHKIGLAVKLQELNRDIGREKVRGERATVVNNVKRLYHSIVQTESALATSQEQVTASRELLRVVIELVGRQTALASDRLDAEAALAHHEYTTLTLRNSLATQKEQMNDLLGREVGRDFSVVVVPDAPVETDIEAAVAKALQKRPDLKQARLQVELADADRRLKQADYIPDLSLAVRYVTVINIDLLPRNIAQAGLLLKWQPLDWGRRGKQVAEKTLQLDQARNFAREAEDLVRIDVATKVRALQESRLLLEAARLARESARAKLKVAQDRQKEQAALLTDVLQAQAAVGESSSQYDKALLGFWAAKADLEKATGED
jgi:outer membrane protein